MSSKRIRNMSYNKLLSLINRNKNQWINYYPQMRPVTFRLFSSEKSADKQQPQERDYITEQIIPSAGEGQHEMKNMSEDVDVMATELKVLKQKNDDLLDKYRRALADGENLRVRLNKQINDAKLYGIQSFCKDLLEVADTLGHATNSVPQSELTDANPHLKNLYDGLLITHASLLQVFKRHGLEPVNPINEQFNPNEHEALFVKEGTASDPNTVIEVTKVGYKLHDRIIRPPLVGVAK